MSWSRRRWERAARTAALAAAAGAVTVVGTTFAALDQPLARPLDPPGIALLLVGPAALLARRRYPSPVLALAAAAAWAYLAVGYPYGPVFLAPVVALCFAVVAGHRRSSYAIAALAFAALLGLHLVRRPALDGLVGAGGWLAFLVAVIACCEWWRARRERAEQADATAAEAARRRVSEQRLRVARDLHDVLGHHVSLINVQAGVALHLMDRDPGQARDALAAIKKASGELLDEMRATIGVLRGVDEEPPRSPVAGLARIADLVEDHRAAGLDVTIEVHGTERALPTSVDQAAYRIVQEALTNTRRHAGPARAHVVVTYDADGLGVRVDDDGVGSEPRPVGGNGLVGMRERVCALGGTFTAGPGPDRGFAVRAALPTGGTR